MIDHTLDCHDTEICEERVQDEPDVYQGKCAEVDYEEAAEAAIERMIP